MHIKVMIRKIVIVTGLLIAALFVDAKEKYSVFPTDSKIIFDFCFIENGEKIAIADNTTIKIFSTRTQQKLDEIKSGFGGRILAVTASKDNKLIAFGGKDGSLTIRDLFNKTVIQNLTQAGKIITALSFSPDNRMLASGNSDGNLLVYEIANKTVKFELTVNKREITALKFSPDGKILAVAGGDKKIHLYSVENGTLICALSGHKSWVRSLSFNQNDILLSCGDDSKVIQWNLNNLQQITSKKTTHLAFRLITCVDTFHEENFYVISGINGRMLINTPTGIYSANLGKPVYKVLFIPDGNNFLKIIAATQGKGVIMIKAEDLKFKNRDKSFR